MRPFLKWAGGKYRLVEKIRQKLPEGNRLLEPFAGSCALALNVDCGCYWLNDINPDLILVYRMLQQEGEEVIRRSQALFTPRNNLAEAFYGLRQQFNEETDALEKAALFIYLNRHGFNGLCRYNASGEFNVPFGKYRKPYFPLDELNFFRERFQNAVFTSLDFETMMREAGPGDVIYCDPPYIPLTGTSNFTQFSAGGFGKADQLRLAEIARELAERGVKTVISNHYSEIIMKAYHDAQIEIFPVQRFISCNGENRNPVDEVLAVFG
ncbi:MAG TPA: Dam family site-specific DNA-(adenine-N6)-methyltransferase [Bacillota bacterium]|nr:Dam family site-specific DNA-(adenine-N6)-methyltransferase [Bacillota bacterium]